MFQLDNELIDQLQGNLLKWFSEFGRNFPWRETHDPYRVLLAEKLLQQTAVREDTVRIYKNLASTYPTINDLANADVDILKNVILPLGLSYRAKELVVLAQEIRSKHNGKVPNNLEELLSLSGVGDYAARAVLCFAFDFNVPIVDTNVARIFFRIFGLHGKMPANPARKRSLIELAERLIPQVDVQEFNWALLDLGALVCKATNPRCNVCPINNICAYYQSGKVTNASS